MNEVQRLEQEIAQLTQQLYSQNLSFERSRQAMIAENKRRLEECRAEMSRALNEHDSAARQKYEELLRQYENSLSSDTQDKLWAINTDYEKLKDETQRLRSELEKKEQELRDAVEKLKADAANKDKGNKAGAEEYLGTANDAFRTVQSKPHKKFAPGRLKIYYNTIEDSNRLFKAGLYEAAAAIAVSARSGLERLGYTIDDKAAQWQQLYELFATRLELLRERIAGESADWQELAQLPPDTADFTLRADMGFWSRGVFTEALALAGKYSQLAQTVRDKGVENYMRLPDSVSDDDLRTFTAEINKAYEKLGSVSDLYKSRYTASCERSQWGETLLDFFTNEINLSPADELIGFRAADDKTRSAPDFRDYAAYVVGDRSFGEDMREWLRLAFRNASEDTLYIYILPHEAHGNVTNSIMLYIDSGAAENPVYVREIYAHICEALNITDNDGILHFADDINALKASADRIYRETGKDLERLRGQS